MRRSTLVTGHKKSSRSEQKPLMAKKMATRWRDYIVRRFFRVSTVVSGAHRVASAARTCVSTELSGMVSMLDHFLSQPAKTGLPSGSKLI